MLVEGVDDETVTIVVWSEKVCYYVRYEVVKWSRGGRWVDFVKEGYCAFFGGVVYDCETGNTD